MANCLAVLNKAPRSPGTSKNDSNGQILPTPHLKRFRLSELRSATNNFPPDAIIGEGRFGTVFKGWLDEKTLAPAKPGSGMVTAVEKLNPQRKRGIQEWQSEIKFLGSLSHPNLVKLLGYCLDEKEQTKNNPIKKSILLVYEFMAEGSLEQHLFKKGSQPLSWSTRLNILIGAARGLAFLHTSDKQVIFRDFKASNILLDSNYHAKLSDFGLAKRPLPPPPAPAPPAPPPPYAGRVTGTYGYPPPEDVATGDLYGKSDDVYGFGGVLLEMLTGLRALDASRPSGQQNLVDWTRPLLSDRRKLEGIMDKQLKGQYLPEVALKAAQLSLKCTLNDPRSRPSMKEVVAALEQIEAIKQKPKKVAPTAKLKTTAPTAKPKTAPTAKPKTAAHPAKLKTAAPTAKPKTAAPTAKPKTAAPTAKPKTAAHPAKPKTAAPTAKPRAAKPKDGRSH